MAGGGPVGPFTKRTFTLIVAVVVTPLMIVTLPSAKAASNLVVPAKSALAQLDSA